MEEADAKLRPRGGKRVLDGSLTLISSSASSETGAGATVRLRPRPRVVAGTTSFCISGVAAVVVPVLSIVLYLFLVLLSLAMWFSLSTFSGPS